MAFHRNRRGRHGRHQPPSGQFDKNEASPQARGLVGWWPPAGVKGNILRDMSGNGLDAVIKTTSFPESYESRLGRTLRGTADDHEGADITNFPSTSFSVFSVTVWLQAPAQNDDDVIFNDAAGDSIWLRHWQNKGKLRVYLGDTTTPGYHDQTTAFTVDAIHHWAIAYDGANINFYLDGKPDGTSGTTGAVTLDSTATIGSRDTHSGGWIKHLGDIRFYDRVLSPSEIATMYDPQTRWDLYLPVQRVWAVKVPVAGVGVDPIAQKIQIPNTVKTVPSRDLILRLFKRLKPKKLIRSLGA